MKIESEIYEESNYILHKNITLANIAIDFINERIANINGTLLERITLDEM